METNSTAELSTKFKLILLNGSRFIDISEIIYLKAVNNYSNVFLIDGTCYLQSKTLKKFQTEFGPELFIRCHKSFLVNKNHIDLPKTNLKVIVLLTNGITIPISRRKSKEIATSKNL